MVEEIKKVENGFSITTDKGEFFLDFSKMNEIIGFKDDVVFGHGDGNLVSLNIVTAVSYTHLTLPTNSRV